MYRKQRSGWLKHIDFILLDILCLQISFVLAYMIRHGINSPYSSALYRNMSIVLILVDVFVVAWNESYSGILKRGYYVELVATFKHATLVVGITLMYMFWAQQSAEYSRITFAVMWGLNVIISWICRCIWKNALRKRIHGVDSGRSLILLTEKDNAFSLVETFKKNNYENIIITGLVIWDQNLIGQQVNSVPVVSDNENILEYMKVNWVDEVFVDLNVTARDNEQTEHLIEKCLEMGITVHTKLAKIAEMASNQVVEDIAGYTVLSNSVAIVTAKQLLIKRLMDIFGGAIGCLITIIALLIVGPIIKIKSPGPIFFKQTRVGKNGKTFTLYKFRSMYIDAEKRKKELLPQNSIKDERMFKMDNDPRIIKGIGTFIRKHSIDELPQFFNVLCGDMSLVGTRPPTVDEWNQYELHHRRRLAIKPGLTGMWQISGRSDIKDFEQVVILDTRYIVEWSLGLDLRILWKTIGVVLKGSGAK